MVATGITIIAVFGIALILAIPLGNMAGVRINSGRFTHIDGMRAIAAIMVVCSHCLIYARLLEGQPVSSPFQVALGAVGVQIFFCITSFLFTRKAMSGQINISELISSRVRRIVPLYTVIMTAGIAFIAYMTGVSENPAQIRYQDILHTYAYGLIGGSVPSIAGTPITGQMGQVWTLNWEWLFYLCVPFIGAALIRKGWFLVLLSFSAICALYQLQVSDQVWVFFIPGVLCALAPEKLKLWRSVKALLFFAGIAAFCFSLWIETAPYGSVRLALCAIGFSCLLFGHTWLLSIRPLRLLGEVSYSIYMLHLLIASVFSFIVSNNPETFQTLEDKVVFGLVMLAGMFILSFISYALVERPFMSKSLNRPGLPSHSPSS